MSTNIDRSSDFLQLIVNTQAATQQPVSNDTPYFLGGIDGTSVAGAATAQNWGPPYYCTTATSPAPNQIFCGYWSCD